MRAGPTTEPVELGGISLPKGARLALLFASANAPDQGVTFVVNPIHRGPAALNINWDT